ncbi:MAG TPA: hypothetical protein VHZ24_18865 [Pirellulales bacterium]|jgi:hypothetical protein|nr:hypothetical protein [Pirellulales bacterium]
MGLWGDIVGAVEGVLGDIIDALKDGEDIVGDVVDVVGAPLVFVINGVAYELGNLIGINIRSLTAAERNVVKSVFKSTVPADQVLVTSISGEDGRAFTLPGTLIMDVAGIIPPVGLLVHLVGLVDHLQDKYLINAGSIASLLPSAYDNGTRERSGSMLIHECTHVWQGIHNGFSWWYVFNSLYYQIKCGQRAYDVDENNLKTWSSYNVEQQAHLIEDWYSRGCLTTDHNYPYVRDNILPGHPTATTNLPPKLIIAGNAAPITSTGFAH